jgi:hypothetical protein
VSEAVQVAGEAEPAAHMSAISISVTSAGRAAALAEFLDVIGTAVGDARYAVAAGILRGKPITGRPRARDALYRDMDDLLETGAARNFTDAALAVAATMPGTLLKNVDSLLRCYRRWRKRHGLK